MVSESWTTPDAVGNRTRTAIYQADGFKYPMLRVEEKWSGKTGDMVSRLVMVADHLLVAPRPGVDEADFGERLAAEGFTPGERIGENGRLASFEIDVQDPSQLPRVAERLATLDDLVEYAEPDYVVWPCLEPNDPAFSENKLWGLHNIGGVSGYTAGADIDATSAWAVRTGADITEESTVVVAVTDTGIRLDHEDLAPNLWQNAGELADGFDNDGNGIIDDIFGYNAIADNGNPLDDQGHGTHCAGTIGARGNNGIGMTGVAWNVQLLAGKFLGPLGGTTSDAIKVIDYSRQKGAGVISASWGGGGFSVTLKNAIAACAEAGIPFVAAAGNSGTDNDSLPHYPSSYDLPNIVAVAATDATDQLTGFSCFGRTSVDIAAPGWQIWSTYNGSATDYRFLHGTSMATPHVSGALALAKAHFPDAGVEELIDRLYRSADKLVALDGKVSTGGRLNLYRLLTEAAPYLPNDSFDAAHVLTGGHAVWTGSNRDATREPDESSYSPASEARTVWFAWQAPYDGFCKLSTYAVGAGQRVVVFKGETRETLQVVYDSGAAPAETPFTSCNFLAESGQSYRIVTASNSALGELFSLTLELVPANDLLSRAFVLEGEAFEFTGSNRGATAQPFETQAPHAGVGAGHSLWFRWTAPFSGDFTLNTEGSATDTVLAVYTGDPSNPAGFTTIGANDDVSATLRWSRVDFTAQEGMTYHLALDSAMGGLPGAFVLRGTVPAAPVITSQPPAQQVPLGGRVVLSVGADGTPPLRYQWFRDGEALPGAWQRTLIIDPVTPDSFGAYHVVVGNSYGSLASTPAQLSEKRVAPTITWSSGDLAAAAGSYSELRVEARGSQPLTYEWRHNGELVDGANGAALALSPLAVENQGPYSCTVSNDAGQAVATMRVTVVSTPFAAVQWRLPEMPGPGVTDMKVIEGKVYAVTGDRIMVSSDGVEWSAWMLPAGFEGKSMNKLGSLWLCVGMNPSGNGRCATSTNGVTWTLNTLTGLPGTDGGPLLLQHVRNIEVFNGRFIGQRANKGSLFGDVYTSTNGIAWTAATLDGTSSGVVANGPFAVEPGMVIVGAKSNTIYKARAFRTTDGTNWTSFELPPPGDVYPDTMGASRWNNKFVLFKGSNNNGWISDDGTNWTLQTGKSWPGGVDFNGQFVSLGGAANDGISVVWGDDPWTATQTFMKPATGDYVSAYRAFNGRVVYGTLRGFLGSMTEPTDFQPFGGTIVAPSQVTFLDNRFFVLKNETYGGRDGTPLVSGDGSTWRKMRPWTWSSANRVEAYPLAGFGGGRFWGSHDSTTGPAKGLLPHVMGEFPTANGLPNTVNTLAANGSTLLAIASAKLYRSADSGDSWTQVTGAPAIGISTFKPAATVTRSGSRWLLTNAAPDYSYTFGYVHYSDDDGLTWTKTTGKAGWVVPFNGKLYGLENLTSSNGNVQGWQSTNNGSSWTTVAFHATNKLANMTVLRLGVFGGNLVALVNNSSYTKSVWFSSDGVSWFNANLPSDIVDFATGLDQFVAYTSTGAILQAGSPPAGGAAPIVRTEYPLHKSAAVAGSWVEVAGEAFDPEGGAITLECRVDDQLIGSSGAGDFRFRFRAVNPSGHTIILRATDAHGLVGSDELRITALPPMGDNLLSTGEGRDFLPNVALVEFNGAYYAASGTGMMRSTDGKNWEPVLLPSLNAKIKGLAAGNGSLVAQTEWGSLYSTRDGVNWVQVGEDTYAGFWIHQPITFSGGRFLVVQQIAGQNAVNYRTSVNGIDWQSASLYTTSSRVVLGDNGVMVSIHEDIYTGEKAVWSQDGGNNWTAIPGISRTMWESLGFALGYGDGVFLIAASDGRVWRSGDGKSWTMSNLPSATSGITVRHAGGRFFVGSSTQLLFSAPATLDGTWQGLSTPLHSAAVVHALGRYIAQAVDGMVWSQNGVSWKSTDDGPLLPIGNRISTNGERLLVIDENGAAWSSNNGVKWRQDFAGNTTAAAALSQVGSQMAVLGSKTLLAGSNGMLTCSTDDGASWTAGTADGQAIPSTWHFNRVQSSAGTALATAAIGNTAERVVLRSEDGVDWQSISTLASQRIMDVAGNGSGTWLAAGANAAIFRSTDHGVTWQQVPITGIATARAVVWFNNQWLLFGAATSGAASRCWSSPDGLSWTDRGANGLTYSGNEFFRTEGHGRLVVWNRTDKPVISSDGFTWQAVNLQAYISNSLYWVAPTGSGFVLATPYISPQAPVQMFEGTADGQSWVEVPRYQIDTVWGTGHGESLFLFAPGRMVKWSSMDLELELTPPSMTSMGVGDVVQSPAVLRNAGSVGFSGGALDVDGWLSADGFFGDGNDVYLGRIQITAPSMPLGAETTVNLSFRLPGKIRPGDSRLVVVLDPERTLAEQNRANNISISAGPVARVPQRRLAVLANGNGTVSADQNAEYYPHGARIALVANPGKGARFAGWGGDAVGSLSETLVVMDKDKNIEADFVSTAALTVFTRGGGTVTQSAEDGIYLAGSTAQLNAVPLDGWTFSGWSGALSGSNPAESLLMNTNKVLTARFSLGLNDWKNQHFNAAQLANPAISGDAADTDGDGLENWREWLRGSNPQNRASRGQGEMRREGNWIVVTYSRLENLPAGHAVRASASTDLANWTVPLEERVIGSANGVETIEARADISGMPEVFFRIGDTRPEP